MAAGELPGGVYPYLVSPVLPNGKIDAGVLTRLIDDLIGAGVHGLSPLGSTGEVMYLTPAQRSELVAVTVAAARGRVPVVAGVAAFSTEDAVAQARAHRDAGVDGIVAMRLHALPVDERGVVSYFSAVAHAVDCPTVLYTNPPLVGDLSISAIGELVEGAGIRYLKDASGNTGRILSVLDRFGPKLQVFSASAHIPLVVLQLGGIGWMAGPACVVPRAAVELYRRFLAGDLEGAQALQRDLWSINEAFTTFPLAACIKAALQLRGYEVGEPIAPQPGLDEAARSVIARALERADRAIVAGNGGRETGVKGSVTTTRARRDTAEVTAKWRGGTTDVSR